MAEVTYPILAINPGSTSTKIGGFENHREIFSETIRHSDAQLAEYASQPVLAQLDFRLRTLIKVLAEKGRPAEKFKAFVGRGGLLKPLASGTYRVNDRMLQDLRQAKRGEHASNLGALLAHDLAQPTQAPAFIVDPVSVDEWPPVARLSGLAGLDRECLSHALNTKAICKRFASEQKKAYSRLRLVVAHLGSGFSISAHCAGKMVDVTNSREEGAFSTERTGSLPVMKLVDLCFSGKYTRDEIAVRLFQQGGVYSYLCTKNFAEVVERAAQDDAKAQLIFDGLVYQVSKEIAAMAAVLGGRVDAALLTGGLTHSKAFVARLREKIEWIAPVHVYPGEDELSALAEGGLRILTGVEKALDYL